MSRLIRRAIIGYLVADRGYQLEHLDPITMIGDTNPPILVHYRGVYLGDLYLCENGMRWRDGGRPPPHCPILMPGDERDLEYADPTMLDQLDKLLTEAYTEKNR